MKRVWQTGLVALSVAVSAASQANAAPAPTTLTFGVDTEHNINGLALAVADREGFFAREGLRIEQTRFLATGDRERDRASLIAALKDGRVNITRVQTPYLIGEVLRGAPIVAVAGVVDNPVYFLVASPKIKSFADLKGRTLTEPSPGDIITLTARKLLASHGLKDGDVTIKDIAGSGPRVRCMLSGACDAGTVDQPAVFELFARGFHTLALHSEAGPPLLYVVDIVDRGWGSAHRDIVAKYIRATAAAMRFIEAPQNRAAVVAIATELTGQPEARVRDMLAYYWDAKYDVLPRGAAIDTQKLDATIALLGEYGFLQKPLPSAARFVDPAYASTAGSP